MTVKGQSAVLMLDKIIGIGTVTPQSGDSGRKEVELVKKRGNVTGKVSWQTIYQSTSAAAPLAARAAIAKSTQTHTQHLHALRQYGGKEIMKQLNA